MVEVDQNELVRERDFFQAKLAEANDRIKSLEHDNAELVKRDQDLTKRMSEIANRNPYRPSRKRMN